MSKNNSIMLISDMLFLSSIKYGSSTYFLLYEICSKSFAKLRFSMQICNLLIFDLLQLTISHDI